MQRNREKQQKPDLKEGYYLDNFLSLLNFVKKKYSDLLYDEEVQFIYDFINLSIHAQRLYVRLIMRKGPYFRKDKLKYPEIYKIPECLDELCKKGFLIKNPKEYIEFALYIITKPELEKIIKTNQEILKKPLQKLKSKEDLIEYILNRDIELVWNILENSYTFYYPNFQTYINIFKLLFFGNTYQDLSEFILEDIGILKFEKYKIRKKDRLFSERKVIDDTIILNDLKTELDLAIQSNSVEEVLAIGDHLKSYKIHSKISDKKEKNFYKIGRFLEKFKMWEEALDYYNLTKLPLAAERKIRTLDKKNLFREALLKSEKIISQSENQELKDFAIMFSETLKKKLGLPYKKRKKENFFAEHLQLKQNSDLKIEEVALNYYKSIGFDGFYSENGIWKTLFALSFWDVIFMPLPNIFFNPFQRGPVDLYTAEFIVKRNEHFKKYLNQIRNKNWPDKILQIYDNKYNTANYLMSWKRVNKKQISTLINSVSREHIIKILDRMSYNLKDLKTGFPDLFIFNLKSKDYCLVEVKGPGDQLRPNQKRWLRFFEKQNIPYKIANVKWK